MRVVIVEDNTTNLAVLCKLVSRMENVAVEGFANSVEALEDAKRNPCDLMVVDNIMPEMSGIELLSEIRRLPTHQHVPVIMITADACSGTRLEAIEAGSTDFLAKPVDPVELRSRITNLLQLRGAQNALRDRADTLSAEVAAATHYLRKREEDMIYRLARAIEFRDHETAQHVVRVARVASILGEELGQDAEFVRTLWLAAPLHDVGKVGIPDAILNKPGKLDPEEIGNMRRHAFIGAQILADGDSLLIQMAEEIAHAHHEHWDGNGYPQRLKGEQIPLSARITAVADVFDALCSERPYKRAWSTADAYAEIVRCSGRQFDPLCVAAFERAWPKIQHLYETEKAVSAAA